MPGTLELLVRLVISMGVVMAVMGLAAHMLRRRQGIMPVGRNSANPGPRAALTGPGTSVLGRGAKTRHRRTEPLLEVLYRRQLAKGASLDIVESAGRQFLVGVTDHSVTLLAELTQAPPARSSLDLATPGDLDLSALLGRLDEPRSGEAFDTEAGRTPVSFTNAAGEQRSDPAWKLAIDSLRERTVRR